MYSKWLQILTKCPLFHGIEEGQLNIILECIQPKLKEYNKDEFIALSGEAFTGVGVVLSGEVIIVNENAAGNRVIMSVIRPGEVFGEMAAFSGKSKWPATVISQEPSIVIFISPNRIVSQCEKLCFDHQLLIMNMLKIISNKALMLNRKMEYLSIRSIRGKISYLLLEEHNRTGKLMFLLSLNRNELADFLNIPRPSLSREMCRMRDEGIIDFHQSSFRINDIESLKTMID